MDYKQIALIKEQKQAKKIERLKILLANTLTILEEQQVYDTHKRLLNDLGITEKEYKEIMGE